jgi:hypothetical protein
MEATMELGKPLLERKKVLAELFKSKGKENYRLEFQGRLRPFDIYTVSIELPKYRLANGRTQAAQVEYIAENDLSEDFFERDLELHQAQHAQHEILTKMIRDEGLYNYFRSGEKQKEPVILDASGFIVNGNRRICAWRKLLEEDSRRFHYLRNIDVIVLPNCPDGDIDDLEAQLQIQRDIKSDYSWIDTAIMYKNKQKLYDENTLVRRYDLKKKDFKTMIGVVDLVDAYLSSRGYAKRYSMVEKHEHAFKRLYEHRQKIRPVTDIPLFDEVVFKLIDSPEKHDLGRIFTVIPELQKNFSSMQSRLRQELAMANTGSGGGLSEPAIPSRRDRLFGNKPVAEKSLLEAVRKVENADEVITVVQDVVESARTEKRVRKRADSCLNELQKANTSVEAAANALDGDSNLSGILEQIDRIDANLAKIRGWLSRHAKH